MTVGFKSKKNWLMAVEYIKNIKLNIQYLVTFSITFLPTNILSIITDYTSCINMTNTLQKKKIIISDQ